MSEVILLTILALGLILGGVAAGLALANFLMQCARPDERTLR